MKLKSSLLLLFIAILSQMVIAQTANVSSLSMIAIDEPGNDVWGFVGSDETEYVIYGTRTATRIYSLEDPTAPIERAVISGASSVWRDIKHFGNYLYVVADQGTDGLLVIDMSNAPDTITHEFVDITIGDDMAFDTMETCHNLYADAEGYAYLTGCNIANGGIVILDLNADPINPPVIGVADLQYSHDVYALDGLLYTSEIYGGNMGIYDISDRSNPQLMALQPTSSRFTHNVWSSHDNKYAFTTDERENGYVDAFDITDPTDIKKVDRFQPLATVNSGVIPHNTHYLDGMLYTSWYTDGIVVTDANRPSNLIQVGQFDTWDGPSGGFNGCWGAYPFLPSGILLASNTSTVSNNGNGTLHILQPAVQRACYVEGTITSAESGEAINMAEITIISDDINFENSAADGTYATGQATAGTFDVAVTHPAYKNKTVSATLVNGEVTILDVALESKERFKLSLSVIDANTDEPIQGALTRVVNNDFSYEVSSANDGSIEIENVVEGTYSVIVGKWTYDYQAVDVDLENDLIQEPIALERAYVDDFVFDYGWTTSGTAPRGQWTRGVPNPTYFGGQPVNPDQDVDGDFGSQCYMTGNAGGGAGTDDVDDGNTILISPEINIPEGEEAVIYFTPWFYNGSGGGESNDTMTVSLSNGTEEILVASFTDPTKSSTFWREQTAIVVSDYFSESGQYQIIFEAADDFEVGHLVEAGIDHFYVEGANPVSTTEAKFNTDIDIAPNPFVSNISINLDDELAKAFENSYLRVVAMDGKVVHAQYIAAANGQINLDLSHLAVGTYILHIGNRQGALLSKKILKVK